MATSKTKHRVKRVRLMADRSAKRNPSRVRRAVVALDRRFVWHPFTQMQDWMRAEPIVIASGRGAVVRDIRGRVFLDANASIWTNLHGHRHPKLDAALRRQLRRIAHSSALGLANVPASILAAASSP